jgi:hypothetical protein
MLEDIKGIITSLKSKNTLQWPKKKKKRININLQNTTQKINDGATTTQNKTKQSKNKHTNKQTKSHAHTTHNA